MCSHIDTFFICTPNYIYTISKYKCLSYIFASNRNKPVRNCELVCFDYLIYYSRTLISKYNLATCLSVAKYVENKNE